VPLRPATAASDGLADGVTLGSAGALDGAGTPDVQLATTSAMSIAGPNGRSTRRSARARLGVRRSTPGAYRIGIAASRARRSARCDGCIS
jgi:hypothetical protein